MFLSITTSEADLELLQYPRWSSLWTVPAVNYYHKAFHLGCRSISRSASELVNVFNKTSRNFCSKTDLPIFMKKNTEQLVINMFKTEHALAFYFFKSVFVISSNSIKVHSKSDFCLPINTKYFGKNSVQKY